MKKALRVLVVIILVGVAYRAGKSDWNFTNMGTDEVRVVTTGALADTGNVMTGSQNIQTGAVITGHQEVTQIPVVEHVYPPVLSGAQKFAHVSALSGIIETMIDPVVFLKAHPEKVVKYLATGDYKVFTIDASTKSPTQHQPLDQQASCDTYGGSDCINIIMKNGTIIFQNVPDEKDVIGSLYRFTKDGILFSYMMGEGLGCGSFSATYYTYYNLPTGKLFYSVYIDSERGVSPNPQDGSCDSKDTKRTRSTSLEFYDKPHRITDRKKLNIQAKSTEEAFYQYYK